MATIGNSPKAHTTITVEARKSFSLGLWFTDQVGRPADLTGCSITLVVKSEYDATDTNDLLNLIQNSEAELSDPLLGYATFLIQAADLDIEAREYPFAVVLRTPTGYSSVVVKGTFDVRENTEVSSVGTTYGAIDENSSSLEVTLRGYSAIRVSVGPPVPPGFTWLSAQDQAKLDALTTAGSLLPSGGVAGQVLGKASATNYDYTWITLQAYDGTLSAATIPAGYAPVSDGADGWAWGPVSTTVDWNATSGDPGSILNKPVLGTAAAADTGDFAPAVHTHSGDDIVTGTVLADFLPRLSELNGLTISELDPTGGIDGDIHFKVLPA